MTNSIKEHYSGSVRVRGCGVLVEDDKILMVRHIGLGNEGHLWIPPGGGVEQGQSVEQTITREFKEETGLTVKIGEFLFINEFINDGLHALEIFFEVEREGGALQTGHDPEMDSADQIIDQVRFLSLEELHEEGCQKVHSRFCNLFSLKELRSQKGFFNFENNYLK